MNITINFHGDIFTTFHGYPNNHLNELVNEYDDSEPEESDNGVMVCSFDELPENLSPEVIAAIANAAVSSVVDHFKGEK